MTGQPLWSPSEERKKAARLRQFMDFAGDREGRVFDDYDTLHKWSVDDRPAFWSHLWDFCDVIGDKGDRVLGADTMPGAEFFPDARLSFAENMLRGDASETAILFRAEDKKSYQWTRGELRDQVSRIQQALKAWGLKSGDRVAAMMPNMPETIAAMLAVTSLGGIWSSCSPDFGERGVLDRFGQIEPSLFIACDGYWYAGKTIEIADKLKPIIDGLPTAKKVIIVPLIGTAEDIAPDLPRAETLAQFVAPFSAGDVEFPRFPFNQPLYIMFSSGTTGIPKCIVHGAGGTLVQHLKEHQLSCGAHPGDRMFYFTTCGWMMWNWLVTGLASRATVCLFDGSPFHPKTDVLMDFAQEAEITQFGLSAKYIDYIRKAGLKPRESHNLEHVQMIMATGSPLVAEGFDYVFSGIKQDVHLASASGGTDIVACFVGGNPLGPVWRAEIQAAALGMAVDVWDDDGKPCATGVKGELVCTKAFPSMPLGFWGDEDGQKYHGAYFDKYPGIWCHGDFAEWTENGGMIIHGRSDATLNPGGVRIGTAEIYTQVEQLDEVIEGLAIGQQWDDDVRIVLFVRLAEGVSLNAALEDAIRKKIRFGASPRHVPARIVAVDDIPRTKSGKITELAVRDVVHGREVKNQEALANPEALALFKDLPQLQQ